MRLRLSEESVQDEPNGDLNNAEDSIAKRHGTTSKQTTPESSETDDTELDSEDAKDAGRPSSGATAEPTSPGSRASGAADGAIDWKSERTFISYVGAHADEGEIDPDGLSQSVRLELEEKAIKSILEGEPQLQRTPANNPGFDLFESAADGQPIRWIEVKAMTGSLAERPVGLSHTQFDCAKSMGSRTGCMLLSELVGMISVSSAFVIRQARREHSLSIAGGLTLPVKTSG